METNYLYHIGEQMRLREAKEPARLARLESSGARAQALHSSPTESPQQRVWLPECAVGMAENVMMAISITSPELEVMSPIL